MYNFECVFNGEAASVLILFSSCRIEALTIKYDNNKKNAYKKLFNYLKFF